MQTQQPTEAVETERRTDGLTQVQHLILQGLGLQFMTDDEPEYDDSDDSGLPSNICGWFELVGEVQRTYNDDTEEWELAGYAGAVADLHYMNNDTMCWEPIDEEDVGTFEAYRQLSPAEIQAKLSSPAASATCSQAVTGDEWCAKHDQKAMECWEDAGCDAQTRALELGPGDP